MTANAPMVAAVFAMNEFYRNMLRRLSIAWFGPHDAEYRDGSFTNGELLGAGLLAGISISVIQCPASILRIQQQANAGRNKPPPRARDVVASQLKHYGILGLYRAYPFELLGSAIDRMVYFTAYEKWKALLERFDHYDDSLTPERNHLRTGALRVLAGILTSTTGWTACYPIEIIKVKVQADSASNPAYRGFMHCAKVTYEAQGLRGFWRGYSLAIARSSITSGITLPLFDFVKPWFRSLFV